MAIPKSAKTEHLQSNFNIFDFSLTDEEMDKIFSLDKNQRLINPEFAPDWEN